MEKVSDVFGGNYGVGMVRTYGIHAVMAAM